MKYLIFNILFLAAHYADARQFDFNKETVAAYFGFSEGPSFVGKSAFQNEAGTTVTYNGAVNLNYSGEFGFLVFSPVFITRFGFEIIKPQVLDNVYGRSGSTDLYSQSSEIMGYVPKLCLEFNLDWEKESRSFITASGGYGYLTLKSAYTLTSAGDAAYPSMSTSMEAKGGGAFWGVTFGHEALISDTTTFLFEVGFRHLTSKNFKYTGAGSYFGSSRALGDELQNNGAAREVDLSGGVVAFLFRFYL